MKDWFNALAPRERLLVAVAGGLLMFTLIITLAVRPIISGATKGQERVETKRELLSDLERVAERVGPQRGSAGIVVGNDSQSLVVVVDRTTRGNGLAPYLKRNQPDGASSIRLRFENAPFDTIVTWLGQLKAQHGLTATSANIDSANSAGRVNCNLTLARSAG